MNPLILCLFVVVFMVIVPVLIACGLWFKRKDEAKGYWDPE
jgi:hypothetical protein